MPDIPANIRKECRCVMAYKCYSIIFKGPTLSSRDLSKKMFELFHGVAGSICAQTDMMMNPSRVYEIMFEKRYRVVTGSDTQALSLVLDRNMFSLDHDYYLGSHIQKDIIESRTNDIKKGVVSGRNLASIASKANANNKKALAFLTMMPEVDEITPFGVQYMSGISEAEIKILVLQHMYVILKGKEDSGPNDDDVAEETDADADAGVDIIDTTDTATIVKTRPHNWYYNGWFAFCMFGPFVPEADRLKIITTGGSKDDTNKANGRKEQRKKKKQEDDDQRERDGINPRGLSFQMKLGIAQIEMKTEDLNVQKKDRNLMALSCALSSAQQSLDRVENRANKHCSHHDTNNPLWQKVDELEKEITYLQQQIKAIATVASPPPKRTKLTLEQSPQK